MEDMGVGLWSASGDREGEKGQIAGLGYEASRLLSMTDGFR